MDRRAVVMGSAVLGAGACGLAWTFGGTLWALMAAAFVAGGVTTPLYALLLAHTNDFLGVEDMPAASGGLVFTFGLGAIVGPLVTGGAMERWGPFAFWPVLGGTFALIALYALYRTTQRAVVPADETDSYLGVLPSASVIAVEAAGAWSAEQGDDDADADARPATAEDAAGAEAAES